MAFFQIYLIYCVIVLFKLKSHLNRLDQNHQNLSKDDKIKYRAFIRDDLHRINRFKLYMGAIFLLPLRIIMIIILTLQALALMSTHNFIIRILKYCSPSRFRNNSQKINNFFVGLIRFLTRYLLYIFGFFNINIQKKIIKRKNRFSSKQYYLLESVDNKQKEPKIIVANHQSIFDIFILFHYFNCTFLADEQIKNYPLIGQFCEFFNVLFINRKSVQKNIFEQLNYVTDPKNDHSSPLVIFPEGTCTNNKYLCTFKKGAFINMQNIKVVIFTYSDKALNPFIDSYDLHVSFLLTLCQFQTDVNIKYYDQIRYIQSTKKQNWSEYADQVRDLIAQQANLMKVNTDYSCCVELAKKFQIINQFY